jgi:pimeloyl-ACP methyl ester carboxylesterase
VGDVTYVDSTDGVRVAVHDFGGPGDPEAVLVFSHGTGFHGRVWGPTAAPLTDRYRCLALDLRGHGVSETPPGVSLAWEHMAEDVAAVLSRALVGRRAPVHGIGHSMGGAALVLAAGRSGSLWPGRLASLWLYEPAVVARMTDRPADAPNAMADGAARRRSSFDSYDEAFANYAAKPPLNELHPDALTEYVRGGFARQADGRVTLRCAPATEAAVFRYGADGGAWDLLPSLDFPVAVVVGRPDPFGPAQFAHAIVGQLAPGRGTLVERSGLGHFGPHQDPRGMAGDIAAWVQAHPSAGFLGSTTDFLG